MLNENQYLNSGKYESRIYLNSRFKTNPVSKFNWIFNFFPKEDNLKILELGCGTGLFWLANRKNINKSWDITLSDYSSGMLAKTKETLRKLEFKFTYEVMNAEDISYTDKMFDVILANNMLYHIENKNTALQKIKNVLNDDGIFAASTMGKNDMLELNECLYDFLKTKNSSFRFKEFSFSLDNGLNQLKDFFSDIKMFKYEDHLKITEADPVINYYLSFNNMYNNMIILEEKYIQEFKNFINEKLKAENVITVTKDSGIFICKK